MAKGGRGRDRSGLGTHAWPHARCHRQQQVLALVQVRFKQMVAAGGELYVLDLPHPATRPVAPAASRQQLIEHEPEVGVARSADRPSIDLAHAEEALGLGGPRGDVDVEEMRRAHALARGALVGVRACLQARFDSELPPSRRVRVSGRFLTEDLLSKGGDAAKQTFRLLRRRNGTVPGDAWPFVRAVRPGPGIATRRHVPLIGGYSAHWRWVRLEHAWLRERRARFERECGTHGHLDECLDEIAKGHPEHPIVDAPALIRGHLRPRAAVSFHLLLVPTDLVTACKHLGGLVRPRAAPLEGAPRVAYLRQTGRGVGTS